MSQSSNSINEGSNQSVSNIQEKEDIILTMVIGGGDKRFYQDAVDSFNAADNGYRIELKAYREISNPDDGNIVTYDTEQDYMIDM